jgi:hypothetical protein
MGAETLPIVRLGKHLFLDMVLVVLPMRMAEELFSADV